MWFCWGLSFDVCPCKGQKKNRESVIVLTRCIFCIERLLVNALAQMEH